MERSFPYEKGKPPNPGHLKDVRYSNITWIGYGIVLMIAGSIVAAYLVTEDRFDGVTLVEEMTQWGFPVWHYEYEYVSYTYHPFWIPGGVVIGLGLALLIMGLLKLVLNEERISRVRNSWSTVHDKQGFERIPITEHRWFELLEGSIFLIIGGVSVVFMGVFCWHFTVLTEIDRSPYGGFPKAGDDLSYPLKDLGIFLSIIGVVMTIIGIIGLFTFIYLYYRDGSRKPLKEEGTTAN